MANDAADLPRIREQVSRALGRFLTRQRDDLAAIGPELMPWADAIAALLDGGKRLRPAFCYWGWRAAGGRDCAEIFAAAAALELLQASALVHDDLIDASDTRRGRPTMHRRFAARHADAGWRGSADAFGSGTAILIGDLLQAWTDELYHDCGLRPGAVRRGQPVLDQMRTELIAGQYLDLSGQSARDGSVASALRVATYKSAKYTVERPLQLGAALAGQDPGAETVAGDNPAAARPGDRRPLAAALRAYGLPLGIAFQLRDDVLGLFGDPEVTGKPVTGDVREGKPTVLIALARDRASPAQNEVLDRRVGDPLLSEVGLAEVRAVVTDTGALAACEALIRDKAGQACSALRDAAITPAASSALAELALLATARTG